VAVHVGHLQLVLEVCDRAQAAQHHLDVLAAAVVHQETIERVDLDARLGAHGFADHVDAFLHAEQRLLLGVGEHRDDQAIDHHQTTFDDAQVTVGDRVE